MGDVVANQDAPSRCTATDGLVYLCKHVNMVIMAACK